MSPKLVKMTFDFENDIISLVGMTDEPIQYTMKTCNSYHNEYNMNYYVEYSLGQNKNKWIFKWNQYNQREQFFSLEQYISFPDSNSLDNIFSSVLDSYYKDWDSNYIIDRGNTWGTPGNKEMLKKYCPNKIKIIPK